MLLTAHDLHEAPWGDGRQLDRLIREGYRRRRGAAARAAVRRLARGRPGLCNLEGRRSGASGPPVHEVMRPRDEPSVIAAGGRAGGAARRARCRSWRPTAHPVCGAASVFIGQVHSGEIYNQYPQECWLEGTRRWLPGTDRAVVEARVRGWWTRSSGTTTRP